MRTTHDREVDAAYVYIRHKIPPGGTARSRSIRTQSGDITLDFDKDGCLIGVELIPASKLLPKELRRKK